MVGGNLSSKCVKMSSLVLLICVLIGVSQCQKVAWEASDYPNPMREMKQCGRHVGRMSKVCDPNSIISVKEADTLDSILVGLPNNTRCPCSTWSCERPGKNKGYHIFVALVKKLKRKDGTPKTREASEGLAGKFAKKLLNQNWKVGECNEEVVIFYSKEDGILRTQAGSTARLRLTDDVAFAIMKELARFFQDEKSIGRGLQYLVMNYVRVLDGQYYKPIMYSDVAAGADVVKVSILTSLITTLLLKLLC